MGVRTWLSIGIDAASFARREVVTAIDKAIDSRRARWDEGVWKGEPGPAMIQETCAFVAMPDHEGPMRPLGQ